MNQILMTKINNKNKRKENWFRIQLYFSLFIIIIISIFIFTYFSNLYRKEKLSKLFINNYDIYKLYSNKDKVSEDTSLNSLFGIIEIPKLKIYYPIFSHLNEDLLKIAPCKFYRRIS